MIGVALPPIEAGSVGATESSRSGLPLPLKSRMVPASLEAARSNLKGSGDRPKLGFFWLDLAAEKVGRTYDLVVMNPPFHHARAAEPGIGRSMILAAATALRPGGRLLMVHNRGLPYERSLQAAFSEVTEIAADASFRVVQARR